MSNKLRGYLILEKGNYKQRLPFYQGVNTIGRNQIKNTIPVREISVSDCHCKLICQGKKLSLIDVGSKNGVFLNSFDNQIQAHKQIQIQGEKDEIYLSQVHCKIQLIDDQQSQETINDQKDKKKLQGKEFKEMKKQESKEKKKKANKSTGQLNTKKQNDRIKLQMGDEQKNTKQIKKNHNKKVQKEQNQQNKNQPQEKERLNKIQDLKQSKHPKSKQINKASSQETKREIKKNSRKNKQKKEKQLINDKEKDKNIRQQRDQQSTKQKQKQSLNRKKEPQKMPENIVDRRIYPKRILPRKKILFSIYRPTFTPHSRIQVVESPYDDYQLLVIGKFFRTFKVIYSICRGITIVPSEWLISCETHQRILNPQQFPLKQEGQTIRQSLKRVRDGVKIFEGMQFFLVTNQGSTFHIPISDLEALIELCGGTISYFPDKLSKKAIIILPKVYKEKDLAYARKISKDNIYTVEFVLNSCFKQEIVKGDSKIQ